MSTRMSGDHGVHFQEDSPETATYKEQEVSDLIGEEGEEKRGSGHLETSRVEDSELRSINISNLPRACSYLDITKIVRGVALADIYLRFSQRLARVSFVDARAAYDFLERVDRTGLWIHNRKVRFLPSAKIYIYISMRAT
jgi:hypothetical protein